MPEWEDASMEMGKAARKGEAASRVEGEAASMPCYGKTMMREGG